MMSFSHHGGFLALSPTYQAQGELLMSEKGSRLGGAVGVLFNLLDSVCGGSLRSRSGHDEAVELRMDDLLALIHHDQWFMLGLPLGDSLFDLFLFSWIWTCIYIFLYSIIYRELVNTGCN
ncbi:hypothetical protein P168DRAFT_56348 [Aspergillus campestris IBT 28561]|uniref:Uncharacterized protein n=1 Tax=Aspergillus campestris (strain IBT 28561) TaxID=1392248 RepID=A0A2I1CVZ5_ASPC2|nr:uncharacterized protein P168DRAFT_56348 [Aspergillus campestris IBT 28561]PKY01802.1 hypothetical protein P168DRAFT_56348 [Aspergillus campestris IBT 28561]